MGEIDPEQLTQSWDTDDYAGAGVWLKGELMPRGVALAQPPGVRSCGRDGERGSGGEWFHCRGPRPRSLNYWITELEALLIRCSAADRKVLKSELKRMMKGAEQGTLRFGRGEDVDQMVTAPTILELRIHRNVGVTVGLGPVEEDDGSRVVRLYFTEPEHCDRMLLSAKLGWKHPMGKEEQNAHAREAADRVKAYFA